jgi:hypothetical protein
MIVMLANNSGREVRALAEEFPGRIGHLYSPGGQRGPFEGIPYALDNGAYPAWAKGEAWDRAGWELLLEWVDKADPPPLWALCPDVVADPAGTLRSWYALGHHLSGRGIPMAFAAQDGVRPHEIPVSADLVFIGGTFEWKRAAIRPMIEYGHRVHVGRVNSFAFLDACYELGVESVDGTGFTRGDRKQWGGVVRFLRETTDEAAERQGRMPWMRA